MAVAVLVAAAAIDFDLLVVRVPSDAAGAGSGSASSTSSKVAPGAGQGGASAQGTVTAFTISGVVSDLYPGGHRPLVLTFTNPNGAPLRVTGVAIRVADANANCLGNLLSFSHLTPVVVPSKGTATSSLDAAMATSAGEACRGANWQLSYTGTAVIS
jgi:hypothetical protein